MLSVKRSTASIWASHSVSSRCWMIASGLVNSLVPELSWKARRTSGFGAPPSAR